MRIADQVRENVSIALDTVRTSKLRSTLTVLGVVIGISTVMAIATLINGVQQQIVKAIQTAGPTTFYVMKVFSQTPINPDNPPAWVRIRPDLQEREAERFAQLPEIGYASLWGIKVGRVEYNGLRSQPNRIYGADERFTEIIGGERYLNKPASLIARALSGRLAFAANSEHDAPRPDFLLFYRDAANYPWVSQALWLYSQMVRWDHAALDAEGLEAVRQVFQPQIYRRALIDAGTPLPGAMEKVEGSIAVPIGVGTVRGRLMLGPDRFFDGRRFDPDDLEGYLASLAPPAR